MRASFQERGAVALGGWVTDTLAALSFFTRWPLPAAAHSKPLAPAIRAVPLAACLAALPAALVLVVVATLSGDPLVAAIFSVAVLAISTGALHEDGLADIADGFWGGHTVERRLEIMRDSRLGTYGTLALILAVAAKIALVAALARTGLVFAASALVAGAVVGRTVGIWPWLALPSARADGLAAHRPTMAGYRLAAMVAALIVVLLLVWQAPLGALFASGLAVLAVLGLARLALDKIGGVTGDVIGAAIVVADLAFVTGLVLWRGGGGG